MDPLITELFDTKLFEHRPRGRPSFTSSHDATAYWESRRPFFAARGYKLHIESTEGLPGISMPHDCHGTCGDGLREDADSHCDISNMVEASRTTDTQRVVIKKVATRCSELIVHDIINGRGGSHDPENHCVPVLEILSDEEIKGISYIVMIALSSVTWSAQNTVGEVVDFTSQVLLGLHFMHKRRVAHRDCSLHNIMVHRNNESNYAAQRGPSLPPKRRYWFQSRDESNRISGAIKYYFVGLGNAIPFTPGSKNCRDKSCSKDREPPEFEKNRIDIGYNPLLLDLFLVGNMLRRQLLDQYSNVDFLTGLFDT